MFIFGEIVSFETPQLDTPDEACVFVLYNVSGRNSETTLASRGVVMEGMNKSGRRIKKKVFGFNRPITQTYGQRMFVQVVLNYAECKQRLLGYGFCDLEIDKGKHSRNIEVVLWRPRTKHQTRNEFAGVLTPLSDPALVELPANVDRKVVSSNTELGKVLIHIQRSGYN